MAAVSANSGGAKEGFGVSEIGCRQRNLEIPARIAASSRRRSSVASGSWWIRAVSRYSASLGSEMKLAGGVHDTLHWEGRLAIFNGLGEHALKVLQDLRGVGQG